MLDVEFVDRYTGTPHERKPWLRGCFGDCEAMGFYPVFDPETPREKGKAHAVPNPGDEALIARAYAEGRVLSEDEDGWVWIRCEECDGTGCVGRWQAFKRLPRLVSNAWRMVRHGGPEDDRWGVLKFSLRYYPTEAVRAFTWRMPEELRPERAD